MVAIGAGVAAVLLLRRRWQSDEKIHLVDKSHHDPVRASGHISSNPDHFGNRAVDKGFVSHAISARERHIKTLGGEYNRKCHRGNLRANLTDGTPAICAGPYAIPASW